jgi:hypothetical protein
MGFGPPGYSLPSQSRTSVAAVISLVSGLVFCIPGLTGLIAVITGIVGIATTGNPAVKGRGMAIAGLILGILSLVGWGAIAVVGVSAYQKARPQQTFAQQFVADLVSGKVDQCIQNSTSNIVPEQLKADSKQAQAWGSLQMNIAILQKLDYENGNSSVTFQGVAAFAGGQHKYSIVVVKDSSGTMKVDSFQWLP